MYLHRDALHCLKIANGIILSGIYKYVSLAVVLVLEKDGKDQLDRSCEK